MAAMDDRSIKKIEEVKADAKEQEARLLDHDRILFEMQADLKSLRLEVARINRERDVFTERLGRNVERVVWATIAGLAWFWDYIVHK